LSRKAVFDALRRRHHYGTTGTRLFLGVTGRFDGPVAVFDDDPAMGPTFSRPADSVIMGDIVAPGLRAMSLDIDAVGSAPIERIDVFHGPVLARTMRPYAAADLGRRIRVMWQGAEYRGRGREVIWEGTLSLSGGRILRAEPVNFLNPELPLQVVVPGERLGWRSVTTGNMAGIDLWLEDGSDAEIAIATTIVEARVRVADIGFEDTVVDAGGLGRQLRLFRLPDRLDSRRLAFTHDVRFTGPEDLPVYVRVTQEDGNQAWSSPIYLIAEPASAS
jgi:hypothetical protein